MSDSVQKKNGAGIAPWLELLRIPNLFTVPGDPWAGALLATVLLGREPLPGITELALVAGSTVAFYGFGLLMNDWADRDRDRETRPERPLPRGAVTPERVLAVSLSFAATGLLLAALAGAGVFWVALPLCVLISLYDLGLKASRLFGSVAMGACRGSSFLLGAGLVGWWPWPVWVAAGALALYIGAVTWLAFEENAPTPARWMSRAPGVVMAFGFSITVLCTGARLTIGWPQVAACVVAAVSLGEISAAGAALDTAGNQGNTNGYRQGIGRLIRALIPWQAAWALLAGGTTGVLLATVLLIGSVAARRVGARWAGS